MLNQIIIDGMATNNDNGQLNKQVAGLFGDVVFGLIVGVVGLFVLGTAVAVIWDLINRI
jgi:hypothetical protein